jgi:hypothetical protein
MSRAIKGLYGMGVEINDYLDKHIDDMRAHENATISRCGKVLEMAKLGFGIGYITSVVVIATGQLLLGNTLLALTTVATAAAMTNPIAMTCAAIGAIYYGWSALSDVERNEILEKLSKGIDVGIELIKSIVKFVIDKTTELLSSKNIHEIKEFVESAAAVFGKTIGDVTHKVSDIVSDTFDAVRKKSGDMAEKTADAASDAYRAVAHKAEETSDRIRKKLEKPASKDGRKGE